MFRINDIDYHDDSVSSTGYIDVGDGCRRQFMLVTFFIEKATSMVILPPKSLNSQRD